MSDIAYVDEETAASIIGYSKWTLQRWRRKGGGPPFMRPACGSLVRYNKERLLAWAKEQEHGSTSEYDTWQKPPTKAS